ncbi:phosphate ABC transporter substrate-binding protein PstS [Herbaspirillum sp. meg3]|uniref:phosphate ABC transporter substrate-binding protein PstS n=1 Tax=Herbaspirillum sp. meg3 TaxID=2025949 RepID=UPI000B992462|nr:phosphate ABC transporter substrate-binding protein PstS [Herbaspirillum sp. meg3]ASU37245.1 phosphate ABC transporter substrate-binding protein PstS [Herbaspirillum sp. meg3]
MKITSLFRQGLLAAALTVSMGTIATAAEITGAGSTFVYPILAKWSNDYNKMTGDRINYQSIGSGGGIAQIKASTVTFGASDKPLSPQELSEVGLGQFPLVIGGVVPVVNLDGVVPGTLKFTGAVLADIYLGKITKWNDPALVKINANIKLPDAKITVVHRSDGSGTTFNWVNYLSKVSNEWKDKVGEGTSVSWPLGVGGKGNEGVAAYVKQLKNSIGYVEYAYVKQNKMNFAQVQNKAGKFVSPDADSFQSAAAYADWSKVQDFDFVITDAPGEKSFPISATTFVLLYKQAKNPEQQKAAFTFFKWALERGGPQADELDYVPLPPALVKQIEAYWAKNFNFGS